MQRRLFLCLLFLPFLLFLFIAARLLSFFGSFIPISLLWHSAYGKSTPFGSSILCVLYSLTAFSYLLSIAVREKATDSFETHVSRLSVSCRAWSAALQHASRAIAFAATQNTTSKTCGFASSLCPALIDHGFYPVSATASPKALNPLRPLLDGAFWFAV